MNNYSKAKFFKLGRWKISIRLHTWRSRLNIKKDNRTAGAIATPFVFITFMKVDRHYTKRGII